MGAERGNKMVIIEKGKERGWNDGKWGGACRGMGVGEGYEWFFI